MSKIRVVEFVEDASVTCSKPCGENPREGMIQEARNFEAQLPVTPWHPLLRACLEEIDDLRDKLRQEHKRSILQGVEYGILRDSHEMLLEEARGNKSDLCNGICNDPSVPVDQW